MAKIISEISHNMGELIKKHGYKLVNSGNDFNADINTYVHPDSSHVLVVHHSENWMHMHHDKATTASGNTRQELESHLASKG